MVVLGGGLFVMSEETLQDQKFEGLGGISLSLSKLMTSKAVSLKVSSVSQGGVGTFR